MEFMEKVSKTVSDVGQKTKDSASIVQLNNKISENDRKLKKIYAEIGEMYCRLHSEDADEDFKAKVSEVSELKDQNAEWNEQIQILKGFVKCPECGEYTADTERVCPHCGHSMLSDNLTVCPSCNEVIEKDSTFCPYCGTNLKEQPAAAPSGEPAEKIICRCGAELDDDVKFCPYCGTPVAELMTDKEPEPEQEKKLICFCGAEFDDDALFCPYCGAKKEDVIADAKK